MSNSKIKNRQKNRGGDFGKKVKKSGILSRRREKQSPEVRISKTDQRSAKAALAGTSRGVTRKWPARKLVLAVIAVVLVLANLVIGLVALGISNQPVEVPDETETVVIEEPEEPEGPEVNTEDLVEEPEITDAAAYQVAGNKPRYLSVSGLAEITNIPVTEFGLTAGNQLGSPRSIRVVGWYYQSAFPGKSGVTVMNAHGGDLGNGIFRTLPQAKVGTEVTIEMGDGRTYTYVIREMVYKTIGTEANSYMSTALYSTVDGEPTLTLITCTGKWLPAQQTYDTRLFVRAVLK